MMFVQAIAPPQADYSANEKAGLVLFGVIVLTLYLIPTIVAMLRRVPDAGSIAVLNVFLGWSMLWWVIALSRACESTNRHQRHAPPPPTPPSCTRVPLPLAAPGWQCDPLNASRQRYFDGQNWTDAVAPSGR